MQTLKLNRRDIESIAKLLKARPAQLPARMLWRNLGDELGVGQLTPNGRFVRFSADDRQKIREAVIRETGFDPLTESLTVASADRVSTAGKVNDEKLSRAAVGEGRVLVTAATSPIGVSGAFYQLPPGGALSIDWRLVALAVDQLLVVVENESAFYLWHQLHLPKVLSGAIAVYRGHDVAARAVNQWCDTLNPEQLVAAYDFDPAGLAMAKQRGVGQMLVPETPNEFLPAEKVVAGHGNGQRDGEESDQANDQANDLENDLENVQIGEQRARAKPSAFANQHRQHAANRQWVGGDSLLAWQWMDRHGSTITQEAMLAIGASLRLIALPKD